ncbi:hypothetical protein E4U52_004785 [Claviceps spartinae]|nr:hypothetical protein E4U52_004785 [Claviceps spartinae]
MLQIAIQPAELASITGRKNLCISGTIFAGGLESTKTNSSPKGLSLSVVCSSISDGFVYINSSPFPSS